MPWYGTVLISFFSAALGAAFAWIGIYIQLRHDKEKDKRQWSRQVRSEPLLAFRKQIATTAEVDRRAFDIMVTMIILTSSTAVEELIPKALAKHDREKVISSLQLDKHLENTLKELETHWQSGEFQRVQYELDDKEIINLAKKLEELIKNSMTFIKVIMTQVAALKKERGDQTIADPLSDLVAQVKKRSEEIDDAIVEIQHLINQRLQEL